MRKKVFDMLNRIDPTDDFAKDVCAGLEDDKAYDKMLEYLENNPDAGYSDVIKKLSDIRGIPKWNAELGKFIAPEE